MSEENQEVIFFPSERGGKILVINKYAFHYASTRAGVTYWTCANNSTHCNVSAVLTASNEIKKITSYHNHAAPAGVLESKMFKQRLYERIKRDSSTSVRKIYE